MTDTTEITLERMRELEAATREGVNNIRAILASTGVDRQRITDELLATQRRLLTNFSQNPELGITEVPVVPDSQGSERKTEELIKAINGLGRNLEGAARNIRSIANDIEVDRDVARTSEVTEIISNLLGNLRLDELVLLPLQVMELKLMEHQQKPRENI